MDDISLGRLYKKHIKGTEYKQIVINKTVHVCNLTNLVLKVCSLLTPKVYLNSKILKHLYDKRPAEEMDAIVKNLSSIVKFPDKIYKNKDGKRGDYCFTKTIKNSEYLASIEITVEKTTDGNERNLNFVATSFRVRDDKYLKKYELIWSWKGGIPSS